MSSRQRACLCVFLALAAAVVPAAAQTVCQGRPSSGALRGSQALAERPYLRIKQGSEVHTWGHPILLRLVRRGARAAAVAVPGSIALVGDLSARDGGPLSGHVSHQVGRDADIAFFVSDGQGRPVLLESFEPFASEGRSLLNAGHFFDAYRNWVMLGAWLSDLRVVARHIFVSAELRQLLLDYGRQSPEFSRFVPLAAQVLHPHPTHTDHFHVRIACPSDQGAVCLEDSGQP